MVAIDGTTDDRPTTRARPDTVPYHGPDRRRTVAPADEHARWRRRLALTVAIGHVVLLLAAQTGTSYRPPRWPAEWVMASAAMAMVVAGLTFLVRWRLVGDARAAWAGGAFVVYGIANTGVPGVLRSMAVPGTPLAESVELIRPAAVVVVMTLLALAAMAPAVDVSVGYRRILAVATLAAGGAVGLAQLSPDLGALLGPPMEQLAPGIDPVGQAAVGGLWLALAAVFIVRMRANSASAPWLVLLLVYLAEARFSLAAGLLGHPGGVFAGQMARLLAAGAAVVGGALELHAAYARQRATLLASELELASAREHRRVEEERTHDLRAALLSIGGAAHTLERYHHTLTPTEQAELAGALGAELRRLSALVEGAPAGRRGDFDVAHALHPLLVCARSAGTAIEEDLPAGLRAQGDDTVLAEVVQNLIDNARRHAPGAPVAVRARGDGAHVVVRVEDRGPGIPAGERPAIFERARRGAASDGSGLGLHIAHRLVAELGGTLGATDTPGGGATFVISIPGAHP